MNHKNIWLLVFFVLYNIALGLVINQYIDYKVETAHTETYDDVWFNLTSQCFAASADSESTDDTVINTLWDSCSAQSTSAIGVLPDENK